jgi:hypothetical protein
MSRVVNIDSPGKLRNQLMRTAAEVIRRLSQKQDLDDEARDMTALLVYCFHQIDAGIDESVGAWEKRDYWVKAEQFRLRWGWVRKASHDLHQIVLNDNWDQLPATLIPLLPHFDEVRIAKFTRKASLWQGAYERLIHENGKKVEH